MKRNSNIDQRNSFLTSSQHKPASHSLVDSMIIDRVMLIHVLKQLFNFILLTLHNEYVFLGTSSLGL